MPILSDDFISDIKKPPSGQAIYRDDNLIGFGVRVTPSTKAFIVETRVNGKTRRVTLGRFGSLSETEAREQARTALEQMTAHRLPSARSTKAPTLRELLAIYLEKKRLRQNTVLSYRRVINRCLKDWLDMPVTAITEDMVEQRHRELSKPTHMGTMGHFQANKCMQTLGHLMIYAANNYRTPDGQPLLALNPVRRLNRNRLWYKTNRREIVVADHQLAEWYRAVMSLESTNVRDYLLLLIFSGLRRTEGLTLRWSDVDFDKQTLTIRAEISKNYREHTLPLSDFLWALLAQRKSETGDSPWVFPRAGSDQHMAFPYDSIYTAAKRSGCHFTPHALRRTFCSVAARSGVGHHLIRKLVNHSQVLDVAHKYILLGSEGLREPMQQITDTLLRLMECSRDEWAAQLSLPRVIRRGTKPPNLKDVLLQYIKAKRLRPSTIGCYEKVVWNDLKEWADLPITEITPHMVTAKYKELLATHKVNTVNLIFQVLRCLTNFAGQTYQTPSGKPLVDTSSVRPLVESRVFKSVPVRQTMLPEEKLADWYRAVMAHDWSTARDFLLFACFTGVWLRQGLRLRWEQVDFENTIITIPSEVCQNKRGYSIPMSQFVELLLRQRQASSHGSDFVFPGRRSGHMVSAQRVMTKVGNEIGYHFQMNDLRRLFISVAINCGIGQHLIKRLTNHSLSREIADVLLPVGLSDLKAAMDEISEYLLARMDVDLAWWRDINADLSPPLPLAGRGLASGRASLNKV